MRQGTCLLITMSSRDPECLTEATHLSGGRICSYVTGLGNPDAAATLTPKVKLAPVLLHENVNRITLREGTVASETFLVTCR